MIDLYGMGSPNVVKIYLALEEMKLPYKVIPIDVFGGAQFKPEFTKLNPSAKVPVIVDHEGPGGRPYTVFESGAILIYLADKTSQFLPKDGVARYDALQWTMVQMTGVGPMFGQLVHFMRFAPKGNDYAVDRYRTQVRRVLDVLEQRLSAAPWLGGADYSIADIATFPWARGVGMFLGKAAEQDYPKLMAWVAAIASRPAVVKALAAVEDVRTKTTAFDKAAPEMLDKIFGRGAHSAAA
ncbi:glutathione S-transferase family protein [Reyranella sp. CPCC 100927]|uniref:glutathione S-transferase family protein n=1 Tax=Reyranella sp. CPCC 100927 TaxID=2599616 RepID=UPI0011B51DB8|nr:glutathione binding-like protein [Reyranella sp. CPCC 100927]TWS96291.1 glutathione S-transferase family protein [Reyranella sp. CPCC 100927]